jgi:hypothetical protein
VRSCSSATSFTRLAQLQPLTSGAGVPASTTGLGLDRRRPGTPAASSSSTPHPRSAGRLLGVTPHAALARGAALSFAVVFNRLDIPASRQTGARDDTFTSLSKPGRALVFTRRVSHDFFKSERRRAVEPAAFLFSHAAMKERSNRSQTVPQLRSSCQGKALRGAKPSLSVP